MKPTKNKKNTVGSLSAYAELLSNLFVNFYESNCHVIFQQTYPQKLLKILLYRGSK